MLNIHDTIAQLHAHITSSCFSVSGSETSPILLIFAVFSPDFGDLVQIFIENR